MSAAFNSVEPCFQARLFRYFNDNCRHRPFVCDCDARNIEHGSNKAFGRVRRELRPGVRREWRAGRSLRGTASRVIFKNMILYKVSDKYRLRWGRLRPARPLRCTPGPPSGKVFNLHRYTRAVKYKIDLQNSFPIKKTPPSRCIHTTLNRLKAHTTERNIAPATFSPSRPVINRLITIFDP